MCTFHLILEWSGVETGIFSKCRFQFHTGSRTWSMSEFPGDDFVEIPPYDPEPVVSILRAIEKLQETPEFQKYSQ